MTDELNPVVDQFNRAGDQAGSRFSRAAKAGMVAGGILAGGIATLLKTGFDETKDASAGMAQLAAGIKSTGNAANVSVGGMEDLASTIQGYSGQTDDSIVASEQLLLTFTNIKNQGPNKIFDLATKASADMAAKMGGDASSNAILLGKALNDPVKGITALTKVGVTFSAKQKASIAAMVKTGDVAGAQGVILKELNTEFGGAAKAAGDSLPGQLARAQRGFEDVSQNLVTALLPAITGLVTIVTTYLIPVLDKTVNFFTSGSIAAKVIGGAILALTAVLTVHAVATTAVSVAQNVAAVATKAWAAGVWLLDAALNANPIALIAIAIIALIAVIVLVATKTTFFQTIWKAAWGAISGAFSAVFNFIKSNWPLILAILTGPIGLAVLAITRNWDAIKAGITSVKDWVGDEIGKIAGFFSSLPGKIVALGGQMLNAGKTLIGKVFEGLKSAASGAGGFASDIGRAIANTLIDGLNGILPHKLHIGLPLGKSLDVDLFPHIDHLAKGGPMSAGQTALVGENGPELFTAPSAGRVLSNRDSSKFATVSGALVGGDVNIYGQSDPVATYNAFTRRLAFRAS